MSQYASILLAHSDLANRNLSDHAAVTPHLNSVRIPHFTADLLCDLGLSRDEHDFLFDGKYILTRFETKLSDAFSEFKLPLVTEVELVARTQHYLYRRGRRGLHKSLLHETRLHTSKVDRLRHDVEYENTKTNVINFCTKWSTVKSAT